MNIGIDFDNTIVNYDRVFHRHAVNQGLIPEATPVSKKDVRDSIRSLPGGELKWIGLQGLVYGVRIDEAEPAPGIESFLSTCQDRLIRIFIISHKTVYPAEGPRYDLREAAGRWIEQKGLVSRFGISPDDCFFVDTVAEKLAKISACGCDYFIDDLADVLTHQDFPDRIRKVLYAAYAPRGLPPTVMHCSTWEKIHAFVFGE